MQIDNPKFSPWYNLGTITLRGTTSDPTKASSITKDQVWGRKEGDSLHARLYYVQNLVTGAAAGSGDYLFGLPKWPSSTGATITIDTNKCSVYAGVEGWNSYFTQAYPVGSATFGNGTDACCGVVVPYDANNVRIFGLNVVSTGVPGSTGGYQVTQATGMFYCLDFVVPIVGWSAA